MDEKVPQVKGRHGVEKAHWLKDPETLDEFPVIACLCGWIGVDGTWERVGRQFDEHLVDVAIH